MKKTLYQILGVDPNASAEDIAAAYAKRLAMSAAESSDPNVVGLLRQANEILSDRKRRLAYDASLVASAARPPGGRALESGPTSAKAWVTWIAAVLVPIGVGVWWAGHRESPPAQKMMPPPQVISSTNKPEVEAESVVSAERSADSIGAKEAGSPVEPGAAPAAAPRSAENVFAEVARSVARVNVMDTSGTVIGTGSGVVIDNAVVVTSCHVATRGAKLSVKLGDAAMPATVQVADEALDLCRLTVPGLHAPAVAIGSVTSLRTGQRLYAIGAPAGLELTISEGIVSALRKVDEGTLIQTTTPISPGSSGGGLFDVSGRLVGITTFQHRYGQNLNFALPADWIGQMRARRASQAVWAPAFSGERSQDNSTANLVLGQWICRDWISGRSGQYRFDSYGSLNIAMTDGRAVTLAYKVSGRVLQLSDANQGGSLAIEELNARKMVLHGRNQSIACER